MNPSQLKNTLYRFIEHRMAAAVMIWGPPGIGKYFKEKYAQYLAS